MTIPANSGTRSSFALFDALPAYLGGKRRLCRLLFALLATAVPRDAWPTLTFLDPFLGAGSVSLFAKAQGFEVKCNDIALRSAAIGRALIANSTVKLQRADLAALLKEPGTTYSHRARENYSPSVFSEQHADLIDRALCNLRSLDEPKQSLATLLLAKWTLRIQPMSSLTGTDARAAYQGDFDKVSPRRLAHYLNSKQLLTAESWLALAGQINGGVFPGRGEALQEDAAEFLSHAQGDILYLDPPYAGTTSYEREYAVLDDLLEGLVRPVSEFSRSLDGLPELFAACRHVPIWLLSFNNAALSSEEIAQLARAHKANVRVLQVPYRHLGSIASEEKNATNQEFIVLATD